MNTIKLTFALILCLAATGFAIGPISGNGNGTFTTPVTISGTSFSLSGNQSAVTWGATGLRIIGTSGTLTDTSGAGTVATEYTNVLGGNTIASTNARTVTNYFGTYFNDPVAGTNTTLTNKYALGADSAKFTTSNIGAATGTSLTASGTTLTLTGGSAGLTLAAGGTNQSVYLSSPGSAPVGGTQVGGIDFGGQFWLLSAIANDSIGVSRGNSLRAFIGSVGVGMRSTGVLTWATSTDAGGTKTSGVSQLAAASLALGNGTAGDFSGSLKVTKVYLATSTAFDSAGTGSPEGVVTAGVGSTFRRTDGGAGTSFYVKESGAGNTGWVAK